MKLFHGSNMTVAEPRLLNVYRALDFGAGFYLTSSMEQAKRWARSLMSRRSGGEPVVSVYELSDDDLAELCVMRFETANDEWLDYVVRNRRSNAVRDDYDVVIGPVANDSTLPVIDNYMAGVYTKEEAVKRLLPQNLTDQYAMKSARAIGCLKFVKGEKV